MHDAGQICVIDRQSGTGVQGDVKRRTRRRIIRTLLTCLVVGVLFGVAGWIRARRPGDTTAAAAMVMHDRDVASCEQRIQPTLQGQVDGWRLTHEQRTARGRTFTFVASINDQSRLYHCEVDTGGAVVDIDAPQDH